MQVGQARPSAEQRKDPLIDRLDPEPEPDTQPSQAPAEQEACNGIGASTLIMGKRLEKASGKV